MRQEWLENCGECGNRLKRYDIRAWLELLVEMRVVRKDSVSKVAHSILQRFRQGYRPWQGDE
jgi:hypothetical protein